LTFILHATNVHVGGGKTLLLALLKALGKTCSLVQVDARLVLPALPECVSPVVVMPSYWDRLRAEYLLRRRSTAEDIVLCFGNLPPLFPLNGQVFLFLQNRYLFGRRDMSGFSLRVRVRFAIERLWLRLFLRRNIRVIVQTQSMATELAAECGVVARVLPFVDALDVCDKVSCQKKYDFIYVASGEPHKNHRRLIGAFVLLAKAGLYPSLCLTLDTYADAPLIIWIDSQVNQYGLKVANLGLVSHDRLASLYRESRALVYPSILESFGLPLIEAQRYGLDIVAAELDYVRDVAVPSQTFDPNSSVSISRAIRRQLDLDSPVCHPLTAEKFLAEILLADPLRQEQVGDRLR
jgi:glycosyltransferase involved in cell wall biosynthesis